MQDLEDMMQYLKEELKKDISIDSKNIPNIDLYMDQLTTFMDTYLKQCKRYPEDKILTKTMINNYAKAKIFPPPLKKKYTKNHLMLLIIIYHLKNVLSIRDISLLLTPVTAELSVNADSTILSTIYEGFVRLQKTNRENIDHALKGNYEYLFQDKDFFHQYTDERVKTILAVLFLAIQANTEKRMAENIIDAYFKPEKKGVEKQKK